MNIIIFGGRGFVGSYLTQELRESHTVYTVDRHSGGEGHRQANISSMYDVKKVVGDVDLIINLTGLSPIRQPKHTSYQEVHVDGVRNLLELEKPIIHMSALGADSDSDIEFLRTKGRAEDILVNSKIDHTILRPSTIFGDGSEFMKYIKVAERFRMFPYITTRIEPIYVEDVVEIISMVVEDEASKPKLDLGGPEIMTIFEMVRRIFEIEGYTCIPVPFVKSAIKLAAFSGIGSITREQVKYLNMDKITGINDAKRLVDLTSLDKWLEDKYSVKKKVPPESNLV